MTIIGYVSKKLTEYKETRREAKRLYALDTVLSDLRDVAGKLYRIRDKYLEHDEGINAILDDQIYPTIRALGRMKVKDR